MEPRPNGRGNKFWLRNAGAPWWLQWSPDQTAGETVVAAAWGPLAPVASMEPRPNGRGNADAALEAAMDELGFNGAPTKRPGKLACTHAHFLRLASFNGAPTKRPGKLPSKWLKAADLEGLQWSPDQTAGETRCKARLRLVRLVLQWSPDQTAGET